MTEMPKCPLGCPSVRVGRDGPQRGEGRLRQRYRCVKPDGSFHRFVGEGGLSRTRGGGHSCDECDRPLDVDGGPVTPWHSRYLVKALDLQPARLDAETAGSSPAPLPREEVGES